MEISQEVRDALLALDDVALAARCRLDFFKSTGKGGQKRNKSSSAVRVTLEQWQLSAEDCTERSQHRNRANALAKLRMLLALSARGEVVALPRAECALTHEDYPRFAAGLLDALACAGYDHRAGAQLLGMTPSHLVTLLARDPRLWQVVSEERRKRGFPALSHGTH
ncbi:MAG: peptide chain release factor-like protein [Victivallaceae bacterium]|nr:peptide chain release factor-like protein [Victivallaceae bacterium]